MNVNYFVVVLTSTLLLGRAGITLAQVAPQAAMPGEVLVVTVEGYPVPQSETPGSVGVLQSEAIRETAPISVSDGLQSISGVSKTSDSLWGSEVSIRGLSRNSVVFLIDGCRVNTATDINAQFGLIDPNTIERIEVLKGPISALYGSGTIGGVVNVITKKGKFSETAGWDTNLISSGMSNPLGLSTYASSSYNSPEAYVFGSQSFREYASFKDGNGQTMRNSQFYDYGSNLKGGYKENEHNVTEFQFQVHQGRDVGIPGSGTAPLPATADVTYPAVSRSLWSLNHTWSPDYHTFKESKLNLYTQLIERNARLDHFPEVSPVVEIHPEADHRTYGLKWENRFEAFENTMNTGLDIWERRLDSNRTRLLKSGMSLSDIPLPESRSLSSGIFLEDAWHISDPLTLSTGGRYDDIYVSNEAVPQFEKDSVHDGSWNAHLGVSYDLSEHWNSRFLAARGYRAASIEERFAYLELGGGRVKLGDPNLQPEHSEFLEWNLDWKGERTRTGISAFRNRLHDMITEKFKDPATIVNANVQEAEIIGLDYELETHIADQFKLYGNLGWLRGRDIETDSALPQIAPLNGLAGVRYEEGSGLFAAVELPFSARQNLPSAGVKETKAWASLDLRVGYEETCGGSFERQKIFAGVLNVFDSAYKQYLTTARGFDFNEPGRSFILGYELQF